MQPVERIDYRDPEVVDPRMEAVERLAWLMDRCIRIGPYSIGIDGLIGLIPGLGDIAGGVISMYVVIIAARMGMPRVTIFRMVTNIGVDVLIGTVPVIGDAFDFAFKATTRNVNLMRAHIHDGRRQKQRDTTFVFLALAVLLIVLSLPILLILWLGHVFGWV
jgi:hypothetical protein